MTLEPLDFKVRLKKSFDALRTASRRATSPEKSLKDATYCPESVQLARNQFLQVQQSPEVVKRPMVTAKRSRKDFRSSLRSSQSGEIKDLQEGKSSALHVARSISSSLRSRFKQAFSRPASELPPQQMDASRAHFGDDVFGGAGNGGFDNYHSDDLAERRRKSLYHSPWDENVDEDDVKNLQTIIPVNMSNSSLAASSKSRVTSWTNTTISEPTHETLLERKRLSVIQEDGDPHQPSSSAGRHLGGVPIARKPLPSQIGRDLDPQRLYSALVRRMNQESTDRATEPLADLKESEEEDNAAATKNSMSYNPDMSVSTLNEQLGRETTNSGLNSDSTEQRKDSVSQYAGNPRFVASQDSVYSRTTNGGTDPQFEDRLRGVETDTAYSAHPIHATDIRTHRWVDKSNPFLSSDVWGAAQPSVESLCIQEEEIRASQYPPSGAVNIATGVKSGHISTASESATAYTDAYPAIKNSIQGSVLPKTTSHVREQAQIQTDQSNSLFEKRAKESTTTRKNQVRDVVQRAGSADSRTPSPSPKMPDQLSVTKRRFPLLNVKQVTKKETPLASRNTSLTRSQSGLLQELNGPDRDQMQDECEAGKHKTLSSSLRKMSPNDVAKLLKERKSMAFLNAKSNDKENRSSSVAVEATAHDEVEAASTPGPAYLAIRSGNSGGKRIEKDQTRKHDSPTGRVKATLSARLSRPFNMDTPEGNRPFDSMYLGKRDLGFSDTLNGRLSVATKQHTYGYNKQRSFDRGPGGYGGLGLPPSWTPDKSEEDTALPHITTPETNRAKVTANKSSLTLGSKRMVSNFLRSRRKENSSESDGGTIAHKEFAALKVSEDASTSSPLFV